VVHHSVHPKEEDEEVARPPEALCLTHATEMNISARLWLTQETSSTHEGRRRTERHEGKPCLHSGESSKHGGSSMHSNMVKSRLARTASEDPLESSIDLFVHDAAFKVIQRSDVYSTLFKNLTDSRFVNQTQVS